MTSTPYRPVKRMGMQPMMRTHDTLKMNLAGALACVNKAKFSDVQSIFTFILLYFEEFIYGKQNVLVASWQNKCLGINTSNRISIIYCFSSIHRH